MRDWDYLLFSDMHFALPEERLGKCLDTCGWIAERVREYKPGYVINLGDTQHTLGYTDIPVLHAMSTGMECIRTACHDASSNFSILMGNHDQYSRDGIVDIGPLFSPAKVVSSGYRGVDILMMAYHRTPGAFLASYRAATEEHGVPKVMFIHQAVCGAMLTPTGVLDDGIDLNDMPDIPIFGGHYHHPQRMGKLRIVGSTSYMHFGDSPIEDKPRGIMLVKIRDGKVTVKRMANPHTDYYHQVRIAPKDKLDLLKPPDVLKEVAKSTHVRIHAPSDRFDEIREYAEDLYLSVQLLPDLEAAKALKEQIEVSQTVSPMEVLKSYVEQAETALDKSKLLQVGKELLHEN